MTQQATLVKCRNPFRPTLNREYKDLKLGQQVYTTLVHEDLLRKRNGKLVRKTPFVVMYNGVPLMQKDWIRRTNPGDLVEIILLPQGGGGGDGGGSNVMQMILMIALVVVSIWVPGAWGFAAGSWQAAGISAAIMVGGTMLLNAMFPPPKPDILNSNRESTSPNYTIGSQNNSARLMEAIPVLYGRYRVYPDLAAQPYTENRNNQQYLYQLLCITQGQIETGTIEYRIEDNSFASFGEIEYELIQPYQPVTLFPDNVNTVAAVSNLTMLAPDAPGYAVLGPYVVNPAETVVNAIAVDVTMPAGLYAMDDRGNVIGTTIQWQFEYQEIDDLGAPVGAWTNLMTETMVMATEQPQMLSWKFDVPSGRYQVRGQRLSLVPTNNRTQNTIVWASLRGYMTSPRNYGNVTLLAVIIKATNNINANTSRRINVVATRMLPVWDPVEGWSSPVATRNIAWALADILRNTDYGRGLPTTRFNVQELHRLADIWETRGDEFNGVFDKSHQLWDALSKVARTGRAIPMYYAGMADFIRNEPKTIPSAMFQPANMIKDSFKTSYQFAEPNTPDHVVVEYIDGETWKTDQVVCALPGEPTNTPSNQAFFGITNRDQAWREGMSMAAANRDQRRMISFTTGEEGLLVKFGDLVQISHDVPQWGYSGRVEWMTTDGQVKLTEPVVFNVGEDHVIAFRKKNGGADGPHPVIAHVSGDPTMVQLDMDLEDIALIEISDGIRSEQTYFQFGPTERAGLLALVHSGTPSSSSTVALNCVNYAPSVHLAETGEVVPPPGGASNLPRPPTLPIVALVEVHLGTVTGRQKIVITPANGAHYYEYQARQPGEEWTNLGSTADPFLDTAFSPGDWEVRVRAVGVLVGPWETWTGEILASALPIPSIQTLSGYSELFAVRIEWAIAAEYAMIADVVEIWTHTADDVDSAVMLVSLRVPAFSYTHYNLVPGEPHYYWARVIDNAGRIGAWSNSEVGMLRTASTDAELILDALAGQISETELSAELLETIEGADAAIVAVEAIETDLAAMYTIKTQLTVDDIPYMAGIGVGVENDAGIITSQILLSANRVAVINEADSGTLFTPFVIEGGIVYINTAFIAAASIGSAKIIDASITNAKIEDATITAAKIANATITAAKIGDAQITTAKIGDAQITTAKVVDANISTLKIAGNAVTVPVGASASGIVSLGATEVYGINIAINADGAPIIVTGMVRVNAGYNGGDTSFPNSTRVRLYRGASLLLDLLGPVGIAAIVPFTYFDASPGAGTHTYQINIVSDGSSGTQFDARTIAAIGAKR